MVIGRRAEGDSVNTKADELGGLGGRPGVSVDANVAADGGGAPAHPLTRRSYLAGTRPARPASSPCGVRPAIAGLTPHGGPSGSAGTSPSSARTRRPGLTNRPG